MSKITIAELNEQRTNLIRLLFCVFYSEVGEFKEFLAEMPESFLKTVPTWIRMMQGISLETMRFEEIERACDDVLWDLIVASFEAEDLIEKVEQP